MSSHPHLSRLMAGTLSALASLSVAAATPFTPSAFRVTLDCGGGYTYDGTAHEPSVRVTHLATGSDLTPGTDFSVTYADNVKASHAGAAVQPTARVAFQGGYSGGTNVTFAIAPRNLATCGQITFDPAEVVFDGTVHRPQVTIADKTPSVNLWASEYTQAWSDEGFSDVGDYVLTLTARADGNYTGTLSATFRIRVRDLSEAEFVNIEPCTYDGTAQQPAFDLVWNSVTLVKNRDYTVAYADNTNATANARITAALHGNYRGTLTHPFTIAQRPLSLLGVSLSPTIVTYANGIRQTPSVAVAQDPPAREGIDYTSFWADGAYDFESAGLYTLYFQALPGGNWQGSLSKAFIIAQKSLSDLPPITVADITADYAYDGSYHRPEPAVHDTPRAGATPVALVKGRDFTYTYARNKDASNGQPGVVTVNFDAGTGGNYTGATNVSFTIGKRPFADHVQIVFSPPYGVYNGKRHNPGATVHDADLGLLIQADSDFSHTWSSDNIVNVGDYTFTIHEKAGGNYSGTANAVYTVRPKSCESLIVDPVEDRVYNGLGHEPRPEVRDPEVEHPLLVEGRDFTYAWLDNTNATHAGTAKIILTFRGNYAGSLTNAFRILPKPLTKEMVTTSGATRVFDGTAKRPAVAVADVPAGWPRSILVASDYALRWPNGSDGYVRDAGVYTNLVVAQADGNYCGAVTNLYAVVPAELPYIDPAVPVPQTPDPANPAPAPAPGDVFSAYDITRVYDGTGHTVSQAAIEARVRELTQIIGRENAVVSFAPTADRFGAPWTTPPAYTNVTSTSFWYRVSVPNYSNYTHLVCVRVTPRPLTLTSGSAHKPYDGLPLTCPTVAADGFVAGEGASYGGFPSVTTLAEGKVTNTFSVAFNAGTRAANYAVTKRYGEIWIERDAPPNLDQDDPLSDYSVTNVYDGLGHTLNVAALRARIAAYPQYAADNPVITYATAASGSPWLSAPPAFTNASSNVFWYRVQSKNFEDFGPHTVTVTVTPRPLTLTSGDASKDYDGTPLTHAAVTAVGFVPGETASYKDFPSVTDVAEGKRPNTFSAVFDQTAKAANYAVTKAYGRIWITRQTPPPIDPVDPDPSDPYAAFSDYDVTAEYDGRAHTLETNDLQVKIASFPLLARNSPRVSYALASNSTTWASAPYTYAHASTNVFWYRVQADNFADFGPHAVRVAVTPRPLTLASGSASKAYDGTPLTCPTVAADGFVAGEGATYGGFPSVTDVAEGTRDNTFDVTFTSPARAGDYAVAKAYGQIWITRRTPPAIDPVNPDPSDPYAAFSDYDVTAEYDGRAHTLETNDLQVKIASFPLLAQNRPRVSYAPTSNSTTWVSRPYAYAHASTNVFWYRVQADNFADFGPHAVRVAVTPRALTVTSESAHKPYDGLPLTYPFATADRLVAGEEARYINYPYVTTVSDGKIDNTFDVVFTAPAQAKDYAVTKVYGQIWIERDPPPRLDQDDPLSDYSVTNVYDGLGHTLSETALKMRIASYPTYAADNPVLAYARAATGPWLPKPPAFTNASSNVFWYRVQSKNFEDFGPHTVTVTVTPRPLTLTSGSAHKTYDGTSLSNPQVTAGGSGFVAGEGATYGGFPSVTTVAEGTRDNTFDVTFSAGTRAANYAVTKTYGQLWIDRCAPPPIDPVNPDPSDPYAAFSDYDVTAEYDGRAHTLETNDLQVKIASFPLLARNSPRVSYALASNGTTWASAPYTYAHASTNVFWYRVQADNFADFGPHAVRVAVTPRPLTLASGSASKAYDGQPLKNTTVAADGFVAGEGATYGGFPSVTNVADGTRSNTFSVSFKTNTRASDYSTRQTFGQIWIEKSAPPKIDTVDPDPSRPDAAFSDYDVWTVYDGEPHTLDRTDLQAEIARNTLFAANGPIVGYALKESGASWGATPYAYTDVSTNVFWYRVQATNYEDVPPHAVKVTIVPRSIAGADVTLDTTVWKAPGGELPTVATATIGLAKRTATLVEGRDYTLAYEGLGQTERGATCYAVLTGCGNYTDVRRVPFQLGNPAVVLSASLGWTDATYWQTGTYFGRVAATVAEGSASDINEVFFALQDRPRTNTNGPYGTLLYSSAKWAPASETRVLDGTTYRTVQLAGAGGGALAAGEAVWGLSDLSLVTGAKGDKIPSGDARKLELHTESGARPSTVVNLVAWLVCVSCDRAETNYTALCASPQLTALQNITFTQPTPVAQLSVVDASAAYGLPATEGVECRLTSFEVTDAAIRGGVQTSVGSRKGALGANVRVLVRGTASLGKPFATLGEVTPGADGTFTYPRPATATFFQVVLEPTAVAE